MAFSTDSLPGSSDETFNIKRICLIGAGSSSLVVAKYLLAEKIFDNVDIYEQQSEVGGLWNYSAVFPSGVFRFPLVDPHVSLDEPIWVNGDRVFPNGLYDQLIANVPKQVMEFGGVPMHEDTKLFPPRQTVLEYLKAYSEDIRSHIKFSTQVKDVKLQRNHNQDRWTITTIDLTLSGMSEQQTEYDAVVVANGHYNCTYVPAIEGVEAFNRAYPRAISHSKYYRSADVYKGLKVLVVGGGPSGVDIAKQISEAPGSSVIWSVRKHPLMEGENTLPPINKFIVEDRAVCFEDGRVERDIDAVVFCTGYLYSYPFLESLKEPIVTDGRRVRGLYQHLFHTLHSTLVFPGLPYRIFPLSILEPQAAVVARVWSNRLKLPSKTEMDEWEKTILRVRGSDRLMHMLPGCGQEYITELHEWVKSASPADAGRSPPGWTEEHTHIYETFIAARKTYIERGCNAKSLAELGYVQTHQTNA